MAARTDRRDDALWLSCGMRHARLLVSLLLFAPASIAVAQQAAARREVRVVRIANPTLEHPTLRLVPRPEFLPDDRGMSGMSTVRNARIVDGGTVMVSTAQDLRILELGRRGELVRAIGGPGAGPGEFRSIGEFAQLGQDSLIVHDPMLQRFSIFGPDRRFIRTAESSALVRCCSRSGAFLDLRPIELPATGAVDDGRAEFHLRQLLRTRSFRRNSLIRVGPTVAKRLILNRRQGAGGTFSFGPVYRLPLHPMPMIDWMGDAVVFAAGVTHEIDIDDSASEIQVQLQLAMLPIPVDERAVRLAQDSMLTLPASAETRAALRSALTELDWPRNRPAIEGLRVDADGIIWVRPGTSRPGVQRWVGIRATGEVVGVLHLPARGDALAFGRSSVLVRYEDEDSGLDVLRMYDIR